MDKKGSHQPQTPPDTMRRSLTMCFTLRAVAKTYAWVQSRDALSIWMHRVDDSVEEPAFHQSFALPQHQGHPNQILAQCMLRINTIKLRKTNRGVLKTYGEVVDVPEPTDRIASASHTPLMRPPKSPSQSPFLRLYQNTLLPPLYSPLLASQASALDGSGIALTSTGGDESVGLRV